MGVYYTRIVHLFLFSIFLVCSVIAALNTEKPQPLWKSLMIHHPVWLGFYRHDGGNYNCHLKINSVGISDTDTTYVTFYAQYVDLDMNVWSDDDRVITFQETSKWHQRAHFEGHTNLRFRGEMMPYSDYHHFIGNVSSDEAENFGTISLRPQGVSRGHKKDNDDLKYGLSIGIPVFMAVCLTISGIVILWWAFKKGYLRHIPRAYKNFTNPRNKEPTDTNTTSNERSSDHEMTGHDAYHIEQPGSVHI